MKDNNKEDELIEEDKEEREKSSNLNCIVMLFVIK